MERGWTGWREGARRNSRTKLWWFGGEKNPGALALAATEAANPRVANICLGESSMLTNQEGKGLILTSQERCGPLLERM
jgi:hypothetical protein